MLIPLKLIISNHNLTRKILIRHTLLKLILLAITFLARKPQILSPLVKCRILRQVLPRNEFDVLRSAQHLTLFVRVVTQMISALAAPD
jgi:hypothetical protein